MVYEPTVILQPEMVRIARTARIDSFCKIEGGRGVTIGEHVHVASFSHLNCGGGELVLGDHCTCSSGCKIASGLPDLSFLYASAAEPALFRHTKRYRTVIGAYAVLFMGVIVLPGRIIGEGAVISAGSVVDEDVPPWTVYKGNPARKVGMRNITTAKRETRKLVTA
jgi:acetyltransferase-like isoleucine patch superfamily enzyme